jgi:hypothetical protein
VTGKHMMAHADQSDLATAPGQAPPHAAQFASGISLNRPGHSRGGTPAAGIATLLTGVGPSFYQFPGFFYNFGEIRPHLLLAPT